MFKLGGLAFSTRTVNGFVDNSGREESCGVEASEAPE
jgi:hypothetical protein